jgi:XRE family transcriptional regulator, stress-response regulator
MNAAMEATAMGGPVIISRGARERGPRPLLRTMIGVRLRRTRRDQGRTLSDVSRAARVSVPYLSEVERGRKEISTEKLIQVARTLGVSVAAIYRELAGGLDGAQSVAIPADPQQRLRMAAAVLSPNSLQTVADFSSYLLMREATPPSRRIGFHPPGR